MEFFCDLFVYVYLTQCDVRKFFFSFLALQENQDKKLKGGGFTFTLLFTHLLFFIYTLNSYTNTLVLYTGEIAGIVLSLLLLAFVGGFVCAFVVVRRRQVSFHTFHASLKFCHSLVQTC